MKTKIAAAAVAGALALTGTAAVAEAAPADKATTTSTDTTAVRTFEKMPSVNELAPGERFRLAHDPEGVTRVVGGSDTDENAGYLSSLSWPIQRAIINTVGASALVMGVVAVIAGAFGVELTWPGDPHHKRV